MLVFFYYMFLSFILGSSLVSFVMAQGYRRGNPGEQNRWSVCESCGKRLSVLALVPVFGYLLMGGRSKCCGYRVPIKYPVYELFGGFGFMLVTYIILYNK